MYQTKAAEAGEQVFVATPVPANSGQMPMQPMGMSAPQYPQQPPPQQQQPQQPYVVNAQPFQLNTKIIFRFGNE